VRPALLQVYAPRYVSLTGVWMAMVLPPELTPLPDPSGPMDHLPTATPR
jgi:hypothetical protein